MGQKFVNGVWESWYDDDVEERDPDDFEKVYNTSRFKASVTMQ